MNAFLLLLPFLAVRFGLLSMEGKSAIQRAAYFAPVQGYERIAYVVYQLSNVGLFLYMMFLTIQIDFSTQFYIGIICYCSGIVLCIISMLHFASPNDRGLNTTGIYQFSRNPMYVAYFVCFIGMAFITQSLILLGIVMIFQISAHWIIRSEERWCIENFGESYIVYMAKVRRYI